MVRPLFFLLVTLLVTFNIYATEQSTTKDVVATVVAAGEMSDTEKDLKIWTDEAMIATLSKNLLTDDDVKKLYIEFKSTIVNPPNPDTYTDYGIANGEESLVKVERLGRKIHNMLFAISDENVEKYGNLLQIMRDVLYLDSKNIPLAIKHDNSRDYYWYTLHNKWVKNTEIEYNKIFNSNTLGMR
jgi:hypothetical protein